MEEPSGSWLEDSPGRTCPSGTRQSSRPRSSNCYNSLTSPCLSTAAQALLGRLEEQSDGARCSLRGALRRLLSKTWSVGLIFAKFPMITRPSSAVPLEAARPCGHEARRRGGPGLRRDARGASSTDRPSPGRPRPSLPLP